MNQTQPLTDRDRKMINLMKRIGYIFAILIISFGALFDLYYLAVNKADSDFKMLALINVAVIGLALLISNRMNRKLNLDLTENEKQLILKNVKKKIQSVSYEAGSGTMNIPVLGLIFPKLYKQQMKENKVYRIITDKENYEVEKELFDALDEGSSFYIHMARHSGNVLGFSKTDFPRNKISTCCPLIQTRVKPFLLRTRGGG